MKVYVDYKLPDNKWVVTIDSKEPKEFTNHVAALIYISNMMVTLAGPEEE